MPSPRFFALCGAQNAMAMNCPQCNSTNTRRGGNLIWAVYVALIAIALVAVLVFRLNAAIIGGIVVAIAILAHLTIGGRVCLDCGNQWR